jgi:hypothetical protein
MIGNGTFADLAVELIARRIGCAIHVVVERHEKSEVCVHFAVMQGVESAEEMESKAMNLQPGSEMESKACMALQPVLGSGKTLMQPDLRDSDAAGSKRF